ncbi:MAG: hypothetical protein HY801_09195, partial [Candidatus Lindowbacteria bacterium]|nr:hypothetical protein [Candidatus Lindowbacteria bacterium]
MRKLLKRILPGAGVVILLLIGAAAFYVIFEIAPIGAGYKAKMLCSYLFLAKRPMEDILRTDLEPFNPLFKYVDVEVDHENKSVTATAFGLIKRRAFYHDCLGCTILPPSWQPDQLRFAAACVDTEPTNPDTVTWRTGDLSAEGSFPTEVDEAMLQAALDKEFSEPNAEEPRRTRAVVVVYKGRIVAERYASGFDKNMPLHGWS